MKKLGGCLGGIITVKSQFPFETFTKISLHVWWILELMKTQMYLGWGRKLVNTQSGVLLEIKKLATTANVLCKIFVVSDGMLNIRNKNLERVQY